MPDLLDNVQEGTLAALDELNQRARLPDSQGLVVAQFCADCGEPIPAERLRLVPTTRRCVRHETFHAEQKAFRYGKRAP